MSEKRNNPRKISFILDVLHLIIGVAVVILAIFAFLNPEEHPLFFPLIFFLAAILSLANGASMLMYSGHSKKKKFSAWFHFLLGILLILLGAASAMIML